MEPSPRAQADGPTLLRLLAHLGGVDASAPPQSLSVCLAQWIEWREAVALSAALDAQPASAACGAVRDTPGDDGECERVRAALVGAIGRDRAFVATDAASDTPAQARTADAEATTDGAFYRQRYIAMQQVMEAEIRLLRGRLRSRLAKQPPLLARLAGIDAVMEQALARRERALLAAIPDVLAAHFERLRQAAHDVPHHRISTGNRPATASMTWLDGFRKDMRHLLLAELDLRMQPAQGLLAALSTTAPGHHAH